MKHGCPGSQSPRATPRRTDRFLRIGIPLATFLTAASGAGAEVVSLEAFIERYPSAFELFTCGTCHLDFYGPVDDDLAVGQLSDGVGASRNAYGNAFKRADGISHPASAFQAIENKDSDGDGTTNGAEILAGFHPGYRCDTIDDAVNTPGDIDFYLDPSRPGCEAATTTTLPASTTTTLGPTTTTLDSTTTTLPSAEGCAQPVTDGPLPMVSDCLLILRTAVRITTCTPACICAPKGSLPTTTLDALICLKASVGQAVTLRCPSDDPGTTTTTTTSSSSTTSTTSSTTSTTSTTLPTSTTTTTTSTTTTTTLLSPAARGKLIYDGRCAGCHSAGSYDTTGFAGNLANTGQLLINDLGIIDASMANLILTNGQVLDLAAFLDGL
jgi:hypothetical protein